MAESTGNGAGGGDYKTFMGAGFGTLMVQLASGTKETPPSASSRAYLRDGLPSLYAEGDFGMRFVGALETLLDPIVAMLDALLGVSLVPDASWTIRVPKPAPMKVL